MYACMYNMSNMYVWELFVWSQISRVCFFQVYRKCYGQHVGFSMFMDNILLSLGRKVNRVNRIYNIDVIVLLQQGELFANQNCLV